MGEALASGSAIVEAVGVEIDVDLQGWWQANYAFFDPLFDNKAPGRIVAQIEM